MVVAMSPADAEGFKAEMEREEGWPVYLIGRVEEGSRTARVLANPTIIELAPSSPPARL